MKAFQAIVAPCIAAVSLSAGAFQPENYVIVENVAVTFQAGAYTYQVLIADSQANRIIQCNASIGATNDRRFDKVSCRKADFQPKGNLAHYRVITAPIDAMRDPPFRNGRAAYWFIDPDSGKLEFCTRIDNQGETCFDLTLPP